MGTDEFKHLAGVEKLAIWGLEMTDSLILRNFL
jgi:hypothetical protein